jgi:spore coat protein U-like protein
MTLLACGGILGNLLVAGMVGVPLALVSPPALAACTITTTGGNNLTYTYTAANINSAAVLPFNTSWSCENNGVIDNSQHVCYESVFDGTVANGANTMPYKVGFDDGNNSQASMTSGHIYGLYTTPVSGTTPLQTAFNVTVAARQTRNKPAGIYSDNNIRFEMDEQGNAGACEGDFSSWDAGAVTYTANFVIPGTCQLISTTTIDFGNLSQTGSLATAVPASGGITVQCSPGTPYTVYLGDGGQRISGGYRRMKNGSALLSYQLYKDSGHTNVWDATGGTTAMGGAGGVSGTATGSNDNLPVYGLIPSGVTVPATTGTYNDTVVVTVTY